MAKNIVLLSDGTGNSSAKLFKTNVWRLFQILDLRDPNSQVAFYDDGVGTSSFKAVAVITGVLGIGLKRNVIAIYSFCCRNYEHGDRIYWSAATAAQLGAPVLDLDQAKCTEKLEAAAPRLLLHELAARAKPLGTGVAPTP